MSEVAGRDPASAETSLICLARSSPTESWSTTTRRSVDRDLNQDPSGRDQSIRQWDAALTTMT